MRGMNSIIFIYLLLLGIVIGVGICFAGRRNDGDVGAFSSETFWRQRVDEKYLRRVRLVAHPDLAVGVDRVAD